jgi:hypothetical protein
MTIFKYDLKIWSIFRWNKENAHFQKSKFSQIDYHMNSDVFSQMLKIFNKINCKKIKILERIFLWNNDLGQKDLIVFGFNSNVIGFYECDLAHLVKIHSHIHPQLRLQW